MKPRALFGVFVVVALLQLALPAHMIWQHELSLQTGRAYKFRTAPVDPYDAFRGRYVALQFEQASATWSDSEPARQGQEVFAMIEEDKDGFAHFSSATLQRPVSGDYLAVKVHRAQSNHRVDLQLPFDRFYMEESAAPEAERAYREHSRSGRQDAYVEVRVKHGRGAIANLYIGGKPIAQFLREQQK